ncbi:MAG TPA: hypothetical protein VMB91_06255, partial [Solirubrobacteraceae bacterium]|nr:hypothetical protein [Solirubrobacteraceae bacterium]
WGGPAQPSDPVARAMGFDSVDDLLARGRVIEGAVERGEPLTPADWARALVATEIAFASNYYGSGRDWSITTGWDDAATIGRLRELQRKLAYVSAKRPIHPVAGPSRRPQ